MIWLSLYKEDVKENNNMGLDQGIFREKKELFNRRKELAAKIRQFELDFYNANKSEIDAGDEQLRKLREEAEADESIDNDAKIKSICEQFYNKHVDYYVNFNKMKDELASICNNREELAEWDRDWTLHDYLDKLLGGAPNVTDTVISKEQLGTLLRDMPGYEHDLREVYDSYDEDYVYFYRPWW